jgi:hypothetical protein
LFCENNEKHVYDVLVSSRAASGYYPDPNASGGIAQWNFRNNQIVLPAQHKRPLSIMSKGWLKPPGGVDRDDETALDRGFRKIAPAPSLPPA